MTVDNAAKTLEQHTQDSLLDALDDSDILERTAFLVVDMQYFDASPDAGEGTTARDLGVLHHFDDYFRQIDTITPRIADLLAVCREKAMEVIHLRVAEVTKDSRDVGLKQLVRALVVPVDSKEAEFLPGLEPADDEIVVSKSSSGVFPATNIDRLLRNLGVTRLIMTGTSTSGCVQSAVYDALDLGYEVIIVADACADATTKSQGEALAQLRRGRVPLITSGALARRLGALPVADRAKRSGLERAKAYMIDAPHLPNAGPGDEVSPYALIFGPAVQLDIRRDTTAVVIIDAQGLTCDPGSSVGHLIDGDPDYAGFRNRLPAALANIGKLLAGARALDVPIVHIRTAGHRRDGRDLSDKLRRIGVRSVVGDAQAAFAPQAAPLAGEIVLNKPASSIFNGTGLDEVLRNLGAVNLVMAGISFDAAVECSLRSAGDRGYGVVLVRDACAGNRYAEATIAGFDKAIVNVRTTRETIALMEGSQN